MGQPPNVPLPMEDLPRPELHPPPSRWLPQRPGDLAGSDEGRRVGAFGTPGPSSGYALSLLAARASADRDEDTTAALGVLMMARASHFGRAPVPADAEVAETVLGQAGGSVPGDTAAAVRGVARSADRRRELLDTVDLGLLTAAVDEVQVRLPSGSDAADGS